MRTLFASCHVTTPKPLSALQRRRSGCACEHWCHLLVLVLEEGALSKLMSMRVPVCVCLCLFQA